MSNSELSRDDRLQAHLDGFEPYTDEELVDAFNQQVGVYGWVSERGFYLVALFRTFERREIDLTPVRVPNGVSLKNRIRLIGKGAIAVIPDEAAPGDGAI